MFFTWYVWADVFSPNLPFPGGLGDQPFEFLHKYTIVKNLIAAKEERDQKRRKFHKKGGGLSRG